MTQPCFIGSQSFNRPDSSVLLWMRPDSCSSVFRNVARASERWQKLSRRKLAELDVLMDGTKTVRHLLKKMMQNCRCDTLDQCGKGIFRNRRGGFVVKSLLANPRQADRYSPSNHHSRTSSQSSQLSQLALESKVDCFDRAIGLSKEREATSAAVQAYPDCSRYRYCRFAHQQRAG